MSNSLALDYILSEIKSPIPLGIYPQVTEPEALGGMIGS